MSRIAFFWVQFISDLDMKYLILLLVCNHTAQLIIGKGHASNVVGDLLTNIFLFWTFLYNRRNLHKKKVSKT